MTNDGRFVTNGRCGGVKLRTCAAHEDEKDDGLWNPSVALVGMKGFHAYHGDYQGNYGNSNNPHNEGHSAALHCREKLASNDANYRAIS
jgi:hypothetical protein